MALVRFDPPGFVDDLNTDGKGIWHEYISQRFDEARVGDPGHTSDGQQIVCDFNGPREQFINPAKVELADDAKELDIEWNAFPRNITIDSISDRQRWRRADSSRDNQDEYCEWSVSRSPEGRIQRIVFTCETPEYWRLLAQLDPDKLVSLYQEHSIGDVRPGDLFDFNGQYNARNKWNRSTEDGAMHLIQVNNTLGAEIELAGGASVRRVINGRELIEDRELIECGRYGGIERHSDPTIGAGANAVARQLAYVTLANPVGIYFGDLNTQGWETPDGSDAKQYWRYTRGTAEKPVRAILQVPEAAGFAVGDIRIGGKEIQFGGQVADHITMKLTAVGSHFGQIDVPPMEGCRSCRLAQPGDGLSSLDQFAAHTVSMGSLNAFR